MLQRDEDITSDADINVIAPAMTSAIINAIKAIGNPVQRLKELHHSIGLLCREIEAHIQRQQVPSPIRAKLPRGREELRRSLSLAQLCRLAPTFAVSLVIA